VEGNVTIDGKPFTNGAVTLIPTEGGAPSYGGTDAQGHYSLETGNKAGVKPGTYKVVLQKFETGKVDPRDEEGRNTQNMAPAKALVPEKYSKPETSDITLTIPSADGKYDIHVKTKP
jgi:hypothetical protein